VFGGKVLTLCWTRLKPRFRRWEVDEVETSLPREVVTRLEPCFRGVCWTRLKPCFCGVCLCVWRQGFNLVMGEVETSLPKVGVGRGWSLASEGGRLTRLKPRFRERLLRG